MPVCPADLCLAGKFAAYSVFPDASPERCSLTLRCKGVGKGTAIGYVQGWLFL